jgi:nucleoside-diphosphate-sugar epimerase
MRVLLAGASGAIGIPLTRQLIAHGHTVIGLTRDHAHSGQLPRRVPSQSRPMRSTATVSSGPSVGSPPTRSSTS